MVVSDNNRRRLVTQRGLEWLAHRSGCGAVEQMGEATVQFVACGIVHCPAHVDPASRAAGVVLSCRSLWVTRASPARSLTGSRAIHRVWPFAGQEPGQKTQKAGFRGATGRAGEGGCWPPIRMYWYVKAGGKCGPICSRFMRFLRSVENTVVDA
jgi:hypothetical protein